MDTHVNKRKPGSLYISGAPGTGKTAVIKHLLEQETLVSPQFSGDRKSTRLNSSHMSESRMPSSA